VTVLLSASASASPSPSPSPERRRCGQRSNTHRPLRDGLLVGMYQGCAEARPWNVWSAFVMLAVWQQDGANDRGRKWRRGNRALHAKGLACCASASLSSLRTLLPGTPSTHSCCAALPSALILPPSLLFTKVPHHCEVLRKLLSHSKVPPKSLCTCSLRLATRAHTIGLDSGPKRVQLHAFIRLPSCLRNIYTLSARHPSRFTFVDLLMETTS
jgi:hypothetical protein